MIQISVLLSTFLLVFLAELGDKTQLAAFSLSSTTNKPVLVFFASSLALISSAVVATLLGNLTSVAIPSVTRIIAGILFVGFGIYMLASKEPPLIKKGFIEAVIAENTISRMVPKIFRKAGIDFEPVKHILSQEQGHADLLKELLRKRRFFKDDINEAESLDSLVQALQPAKKIHKMPLEQALAEICRLEQAGIAYYQYLADHLAVLHHAQDKSLRNALLELVEEENTHLKVFNNYREKSRDA